MNNLHGPEVAGRHEAVRSSEERYRLLVQSVRDYAIFMLDVEGHIVTWNAGAEATKGYSAEEIIGKHIRTFYTPEDQADDRPMRLLGMASQEGRVEDEGWRVRKDGTRFWADVVLTAIHDDAGTLIGFSKVTRDLTTKREADEALRQSEERFRVLVQSVKDYAIFMLDPGGRVVTWNTGASSIKGYSANEIIGEHFSKFFPPGVDTDAKCNRELEIALADGKFEEEGWRVRKDGTQFWASVVLEPLRRKDGALIGFAKVTRDLTDKRAMELEKLRLAQALEAIRLRDEFLSIASHELKTPLTAVQLQLETLLHSTTELDDKVRRRAERAYKGGERLGDLVETLLDVSRIASGKFSLKPTDFDLVVALKEVVDRFEEHAAREGCELVLQSQGAVLGKWDRLRVEQIVTNLLGNALKYAAGTPVEISVQADNETVVVAVSDRGPGIPEADRDRVFGRFERASSARHFGGLGLGLYVARQITDAHGGSISITDVKPQGLCVTVRLPRMTEVTEGVQALHHHEVAR